MTAPQIVLIATVLFVGLPAALKNWTAAGLILSWAFMESLWRLTGEVSPTSYYFLADLTVLTIIYIKPPAHDCFPYGTFGRQLCAAWLERSYWDRVVIIGFASAWFCYAALSPEGRWYPLWAISILQFLAAGGEALQSWRAANASLVVTEPDTPSSGPLCFAAGGGEYG